MTDPILPLTALVTTPETSERLQDAGLRARSLCAWVYPLGKDERRLAVPWDWERGAADAYFDPLPAWTVAELGALLPQSIEAETGYEHDAYHLETYRDDGVWTASFTSSAGLSVTRLIEATTEAEARALLFLALHERDLLPSESYGVTPPQIGEVTKEDIEWGQEVIAERTQDTEDA